MPHTNKYTQIVFAGKCVLEDKEAYKRYIEDSLALVEPGSLLYLVYDECEYPDDVIKAAEEMDVLTVVEMSKPETFKNYSLPKSLSSMVVQDVVFERANTEVVIPIYNTLTNVQKRYKGRVVDIYRRKLDEGSDSKSNGGEARGTIRRITKASTRII